VLLALIQSSPFDTSEQHKPTFLNLDKPCPDPVFTVLIWGENRSKFGTPDSEYKGKRICATGKITAYKGGAEIVANDPQQIKAEKRARLGQTALAGSSSIPSQPSRYSPATRF
jgi:hypothetical protein